MSSATETPTAALNSEHREWLAEMGALLGVQINAAPGPEANGVETDGVKVDGAKTDGPKADGAKAEAPKVSGGKAAFKVTDKESGAGWEGQRPSGQPDEYDRRRQWRLPD